MFVGLFKPAYNIESDNNNKRQRGVHMSSLETRNWSRPFETKLLPLEQSQQCRLWQQVAATGEAVAPASHD